MDKNEPSNCSAFAFGAPKFERLPTTIRAGSSTRPGCVKARRSGLELIGLPGRKVPIGETADAPGMPEAIRRPSMKGGACLSPAIEAVALPTAVAHNTARP